jgi:hypothetical protein
MELFIAKQTKEIYLHKDTKEKLYRTKAAVWCNKMCQEKRLTEFHPVPADPARKLTVHTAMTYTIAVCAVNN